MKHTDKTYSLESRLKYHFYVDVGEFFVYSSMIIIILSVQYICESALYIDKP